MRSDKLDRSGQCGSLERELQSYAKASRPKSTVSALLRLAALATARCRASHSFDYNA